MDSAREKLKRANLHLGSLNRVLRRFAANDPYRIGFRVIREDETRYATAYVDVWNPLPASMPLIVGDICNNLRLALDHLLWQCWLDVDPGFDRSAFFPIVKSPELFDATFRQEISGLPGAQRTLIEQAQPYKRGNNLLVILNEMDQMDKQRLLPVATATEQMEKVLLIGYQTVPEYETVHFTVPPEIQIEKGAELERFPLDNLEPTGNGHEAESIQFNFRFIQPEAAAGLGVLSTLRDIRDEVLWVIDQFENPSD